MNNLKISSLLKIGLLAIFIMACNSPIKIAKSRKNLTMPALVDIQKFKDELPVREYLSAKAEYDKTSNIVPPLNYIFSIDKNGDIHAGKITSPQDSSLVFFNSYIDNVFNRYKWLPSYYNNNKSDKLNATVKLIISNDSEENSVQATLRLIHLPDKETLEDVQLEENLISKVSVKYKKQ